MALLPHAQAALDATNAGMGRLTIYSGSSGGTTAVRDIADAHERSETYGGEHRDRRAARPLACQLHPGGGRCGRARDQLAALLPVRKGCSARGAPGQPREPRLLEARGPLVKEAPSTGRHGLASYAEPHTGHWSRGLVTSACLGDALVIGGARQADVGYLPGWKLASRRGQSRVKAGGHWASGP